jgi:pSer/pThr/pTyr-binding forkhead associated (FHA) protein
MPEGGCWIEDLRSTNGTYVDGARVRKAWLTPENRVRIGDVELRVG